MSKEYLIAGNWKMNLNVHDASLLVHHLDKEIRTYKDVDVVLAPSSLVLQPLSLQIDRRKFRLATQNAHYKDAGAFTGEVSFSMLRHLVDYAIIGHSERRLYFNETLEIVRDKVAAAVRNGITPIICIGESQQERRAGETKQVIHDQLTTAIKNLTSEEIGDVIVAYEPVWAISTFGGELARPEDVKKVIDFIRNQIAELYGKKVSERVRLLYGGSVDDKIARSYLEIEGVNGALVGSASISPQKFAGIVAAAHALAREEYGKYA